MFTASLLAVALPAILSAQGTAKPKPKPSGNIEVAQWIKSTVNPLTLAKEVDTAIHGLRNVQCDGKMSVTIPSRQQRGQYELHALLAGPTTFRLDFAGFMLDTPGVLTVSQVKGNGRQFTARDMLAGRATPPAPATTVSVGKTVTPTTFAGMHTELIWGSYFGYDVFSQLVSKSRTQGLKTYVQTRTLRRLGQPLVQKRLVIESATKDPKVAPEFRIYVVVDDRLDLPLRVSASAVAKTQRGKAPYDFAAVYAWKKSAKPFEAKEFKL